MRKVVQLHRSISGTSGTGGDKKTPRSSCPLCRRSSVQRVRVGMEIKTRSCLLETALSSTVFVPRSPLRFHWAVRLKPRTVLFVVQPRAPVCVVEEGVDRTSYLFAVCAARPSRMAVVNPAKPVNLVGVGCTSKRFNFSCGAIRNQSLLQILLSIMEFQHVTRVFICCRCRCRCRCRC